ncbi:hypothetical protein BTO20_38090 (plasmid) [Mycobacterium dioxanotrophicus]|uniref:Transposase n=1 Tax=Mycobacterium dioxanotrophicus TaxID=482462 RepID=A0A1Y0CGP6_9MYCO|nr:hypothetical protein BTO20_38090 [Mycobacterium dioxanotrophicus]
MSSASLATVLSAYLHPRFQGQEPPAFPGRFSLGIDGRLAKTLTTSNPVESMISIARTTNRNVTRWRDGQMVLRWTAAGMLNAERAFRRIKGHKQMPQLVAALHRHAHPKTAAGTEAVGAAA